MTGSTQARAPWHFWVIGVAATLWSAMACLDYWKTVTRDMNWLAAVPPDMMDWLDATPTWAMAGWAMGVGCALAGSLLLLMRSRWAVAFFALSLVGLAVNQVYLLVSDAPAAIRSPSGIALRVVIWIVGLALLWYAVQMRGRRVLA
ncbi:hypothetical protein EDF56_105204 [Novosphingobium sp. PhB165]|uniref:hypothetical protein n=1 Tax=Novosphingobium sp. PhB165 TaxID=2485105 RepID=UPI0010492B16|nr:hypothetical protein [Novosphingobium sp. PhB165]TCM17860.1 hypothetical protein EDF56_105204 [Novosphingobium sp. PhB165]